MKNNNMFERYCHQQRARSVVELISLLDLATGSWIKTFLLVVRFIVDSDSATEIMFFIRGLDYQAFIENTPCLTTKRKQVV